MDKIKRQPSSIHIYLADGQPDGLRTVEKPGWIGHALAGPRSRFPEEKTRPEFALPGVYVLHGPSVKGDLTVYVGEGETTRPRLEQHYREKDFWDSLIVFTSKDNKYLTKTHIKYLESRLYSLARDAKQCELDNDKVPQLPNLGVPETAAMEAFLEEMLIIYPLLGLTAFAVPGVKPPPGRLLSLKV